MRIIRLLFTLAAMAAFLAVDAAAAKFKLTDGTVISGEAVNYDTRGIVFKYDEEEKQGKPGGYSQRIPWEKFSQETLKELAKSPKATRYVELLIELPEASLPEDMLKEEPKPKRPEIVVQPAPSPGRPHADARLMGALFSGSGALILLLLFGANIYAAYEIARFRKWHPAIVCGAAAVAPVIAPVAFLSMPTRVERAPEPEPVEEHPVEVPVAEPVEVAMAEPVAAPAALPPTQVFRRGEFNINRRFIETKFAPYFRLVPGDAEKEMVLHMKTARGEFVGRRIARITNTELALVLEKEGATTEEVIPINDIFEIQLRHQDAPPA